MVKLGRRDQGRGRWTGTVISAALGRGLAVPEEHREIVAARAATQTIPIVMTNSGDAVREGFVASLDV